MEPDSTTNRRWLTATKVKTHATAKRAPLTRRLAAASDLGAILLQRRWGTSHLNARGSL